MRCENDSPFEDLLSPFESVSVENDFSVWIEHDGGETVRRQMRQHKRVEMRDKVVEGKPKFAVLFDLQVESFLRFLGYKRPSRGLVGPFALKEESIKFEYLHSSMDAYVHQGIDEEKCNAYSL